MKCFIHNHINLHNCAAASHQHAVKILKCIDTFNVVNDSIECVKSLFFWFSPGQTLTKKRFLSILYFCQFFVVLHKITYVVQRSCTGLPIKYLRKQSMGSYTSIDQVEKCWKMLKNNNQKHDFLNHFVNSCLCYVVYKIEHYRINEVTSTCSQNG